MAGSCQKYITLQLTKGYWKIHLMTESGGKTAFGLYVFGLYQFQDMSFGHLEAEKPSQRLTE